MDWFLSCLSDLLCQWCDVKFSNSHLQCSVRLCAGPVLFISYTDDVTLVCNKCEVNHRFYADDKQAYISDVPVSTVSLAHQVLQPCISDISSCGAHLVDSSSTLPKLN